MKLRMTALVSMMALTFAAVAIAADTKTAEITSQPAKAARLVDVNTATEDQLKAIPGVSADQARKIIAGRPYYKKNELKTKEVISADLFNKIQKLISAVC